MLLQWSRSERKTELYKLNISAVVKKAKEDMLNQEVKGGWSIRESKGAYNKRLQLSVATVKEAGRYSFLNRKTV